MSKSAHVPERAFARRFSNEGRQVKKALLELIREGYVKQHPTRGEMIYDLTDEGLAGYLTAVKPSLDRGSRSWVSASLKRSEKMY